MRNLIHKIKQRPVRHRQRILYVWSFGATLIVVMIWVSLLQFDKIHTGETAAKTNTFAPFKTIGDAFSGIWDNSRQYSASMKASSIEVLNAGIENDQTFMNENNVSSNEAEYGELTESSPETVPASTGGIE